MRRLCDSCKTPLSGRLGHGFVTRRGNLVCGRTKVPRTIKKPDGTCYFDEEAAAPRGCRA